GHKRDREGRRPPVLQYVLGGCPPFPNRCFVERRARGGPPPPLSSLLSLNGGRVTAGDQKDRDRDDVGCNGLAEPSAWSHFSLHRRPTGLPSAARRRAHVVADFM